MEKKQTAVDWIIDKIIENNNFSEFPLSIFDVAEAKEMEMITYAELTTSLIHRLLKLNLCSIEL